MSESSKTLKQVGTAKTNDSLPVIRGFRQKIRIIKVEHAFNQ